MSPLTVVNYIQPTFNVSVPTRPDRVFIIRNKEENLSTSWCPNPDLEPGIRNRLIKAVGRMPREFLLPPRDVKVFDTIEAGEIRLLGHSLAAGYQTVRGQGSKGGR
jgi:hypothetical protein